MDTISIRLSTDTLHQFVRKEYLDHLKKYGNNDAEWWPDFMSHLKSELYGDFSRAVVYVRGIEFNLFRENIGNQP